jgi:hypothetical protein
LGAIQRGRGGRGRLTIEQKRGIRVTEGILHYKNADIPNIEVHIVVGVKGGRCAGGGRGERGVREGEHLVIPILEKGLGVREKKIARVHVLLD